MRTIGSALTGTQHLGTGSGKPSQMVKSDPGHEVAKAETLAALPSTRDDPMRDAAIKDEIRAPLLSMTPLAHMNDSEARQVWEFWVEVLRPYPPHWIRDAFAYFARNGGGKFLNPQTITEIINRRKGG